MHSSYAKERETAHLYRTASQRSGFMACVHVYHLYASCLMYVACDFSLVSMSDEIWHSLNCIWGTNCTYEKSLEGGGGGGEQENTCGCI